MKIADFVHLGEKNSGVIKVKVVTKQPKTEFFSVMDDGTLKIRLKAVPEKGLANKELIRFLSDELGIPKSKFDILSVVTGPVKRVRVG